MECPAARGPITGAALVVLLALSACGNPFDADADAEDHDQAEGQGEGAGSEEGPPTFAELQDQMWDVMGSADSVTIEGEVEASEADLDELFDGIDEDERGEVVITGALDGTHSQMRYTAGEAGGFAQRAVEGSEYFYGENFAELFHSGLDDELAEAVDQDFIDELIDDQWVAFADQGGSVFSAEDFLRTWQRQLENEDLSGITGEEDTRDSGPVWVYSDDQAETEYVVSAEGEPHLVQLRDEENHYTFSDWDSAELPEEPQEVITVEEITEAIAEDQGWPTDEVGEDGMPAPEDTEDDGDT